MRWNEYQLCKDFGWTPSQLRQELAEDIELFLQLRNAEIEAENANQSRKQ